MIKMPFFSPGWFLHFSGERTQNTLRFNTKTLLSEVDKQAMEACTTGGLYMQDGNVS